MLRKTFQKWCVGGLLCIAAASLQAQTAETADRETKWQQDIQVFVDTLSAPGQTKDLKRGIISRGQKDFSKLYPPVTFDAAIASLKADIPKISDDEISLRLMELVASAHVAHNGVTSPGKDFDPHLPLRFYWYTDGLAVDAASQEYADALGARVVKIGDDTPEQLLAKFAPYINYENDSWLRFRVTQYLREEAVLRHFELIGPDGRVAITLEKPGQLPFTVSVGLADSMPTLIGLARGLHLPTPLYWSHPKQYYWYQYMEDSQTLYIQYTQCENDPKLSFKDFTEQVLAEADAHPVKRVVIDLRFNGGGKSWVIDPLMSGLASRAKSIGHPYVLIGPGTFSSALLNAIDLHEKLKATLVGEPTGGSLNIYGEVGYFVLPNSKIVINYTTKYFEKKNAAPTALKPDILAPHTLVDDLAGRDAALEAAIAAP